jgi:hypothetical protein
MALTRGVLLFAHMDAISEPKYSDEGLSYSTLTGDRSVCLGLLINIADFPINLSVSDLFLYIF